MKAPKKPGTLATRVTVRRLLGLTKQGTYKATKREDFPAPLDVPDEQPIWSMKDIERYLKNRKDGRTKDGKAKPRLEKREQKAKPKAKKTKKATREKGGEKSEKKEQVAAS